MREAENPQQAVIVWESWQPHPIFMDMRMPVTNGYEATQKIRATLKGQATVIVALTASAFEKDRKIVLGGGCGDFIRKPFQERELLNKIAADLGVKYRDRVTFEANQKARSVARNEAISAFWEWGIRNCPWVHSVFLQRFDAPDKTDVLPKYLYEDKNTMRFF